MSDNRLGFLDSQKGLILSGIALLLILPALLITSTYLMMIQEGGEATSIQSTSDKVFYTGLDIENTIHQMDLYDMNVNNSTLDSIERKYEINTALEVELHRTDNIVTIKVTDPKKTAEYSSQINLS
ncbi:hypothetical protein AKJ57_01905 [candidate division MSBL1 archaeon SCGC-AAA259A05]|uniref:Uncharacterized protein n=1 Tax=candidate division MSBL1 archaeon SCGC-AAA259A05 TaxID=1698259 RepID=A0A133UAM0_9EURY|nr:hypothetical protein AKJ57_01905 [candidate division MSBL1 archaeon SCGC-AAA259A05]